MQMQPLGPSPNIDRSRGDWTGDVSPSDAPAPDSYTRDGFDLGNAYGAGGQDMITLGRAAGGGIDVIVAGWDPGVDEATAPATYD